MIDGFPGLVFDGHTDVPTRLLEWREPLSVAQPQRHVDLPRLRAGGVDALVFALYVPAELDPLAGLERARRQLARVHEELAPGGLALARGVVEVRARARAGEIAVVLGLENGRPLLVDGALDELVAAGVRMVTLTHVATHEWCDASTDAPQHGGLSPRGEEIVRELNRRGVAIDVSHVSDGAVEHVLATSRAPVVASHSSARALCPQPRNLPDPLLRAIAERGGVIMANAYPAFLCADAAAVNDARLQRLGPALAALREAYGERPDEVAAAQDGLLRAHPLPSVPLARFVDHLLHLVAVAGERQVGIGSDFDGIPEVPVGFEDPSRFPALAEALLARGLSRVAVAGILGENALRVLGEIERAAV